MQELIKQRFDPSKFSGVFTRGGGGPPKWLDGLASDRHASEHRSGHVMESVLLCACNAITGRVVSC